MKEFFIYIVVPGFLILGALEILKAVFEFFIKAMSFVGALLVAVVPVAILGYLSQQFFGMTPFEVGIQTVGTEATLSLVAYRMFSNVNGGAGLDPNE